MQFDFEDTENNILDAFLKDAIQRNSALCKFVYDLNKFDGGMTISLDGRWGSGKTFFLRQVKMLFEAFDNVWAEDCLFAKSRERIIANFRKILNKTDFSLEKHTIIYYSAWENDSDTDPIQSIVYNICEDLYMPFQSKIECNFENIVGAAERVVEAVPVVGRFAKGLREAKDELTKIDLLQQIKNEREFKESVHQFLDELSANNKKVIIIIDELDRCNPEYAIKFLERIKHYFQHKNIIFIFSLDMRGLTTLVHRYYGNDFDADTYLDKFFDLSLSIPLLNIGAFNLLQGNELYSTNTADIVRNIMIDRYRMEMRQIKKYNMFLKLAIGNIEKAYLGCHEEFRISVVLCNAYVLPMLVAMRMCNIKGYYEIIEGKGEGLFIEILSSTENMRKNILRYLCDKDIQTGQHHIISDDDLVKGKLREFYRLLFIEKYVDADSKTFGTHTLFKENKNILIESASLMSDFS